MVSDSSIVTRHVGRRMRALRKQRGLTAQRLADHLDLSVSDLHRFERGEARIAPNLLLAMARRCAVGLDWFFGDAPVAAGSPDDDLLGRFLALPEAPRMMQAFVAIEAREGRVIVVNFARMVASPNAQDSGSP